MVCCRFDGFGPLDQVRCVFRYTRPQSVRSLTMSTYSCAEKQLLFDTSDALLLLEKLEEVMTAVNQGAEEEYLGPCKRLLTSRQQRAIADKKSAKEEDALNQLGIVRLLLAFYFTRCNVPGKSEITVE